MSIDPSTIKPVTVAPGKVTANAWFYLTDAPEVPERFTGEPFQPTGGWWTTVFHPRYGYSGPEVILCDDAQPAHFANYTPEDAPIWVPRPADGWDLGVRIAADRHAGEAEADHDLRHTGAVLAAQIGGGGQALAERQPTSDGEHRRFIRQETAAERWDVSVDTIRRLIASGKITGYRLNGRIIRVDLDEVDACFREIPTVKAVGA